MRRRRRAYPTDLTDAQWAAIAELVPEARPGGRPRRTSPREIVNAILYMLRGGQAWRLLPHDFPPWQTVYYYLRRWQAEGVWERIHHAVLMADRERAGRDASPTAAIIDSQSVRTGDQKGALAAMTRARRSRGASGTS
jgi:transposase